MIRAKQVSEVFEALLKEAGWYPGRCVNVDYLVTMLEAAGFVRNELAVDLLESYSGLRVFLPAAGISPYNHELRFDPLRAASGESDRALDWGAELGTPIFPIGEETMTGNIIWVGGDGKHYFGREFGLYLLGDSFSTAMDALAIPSTELELCAD